MGAGIFVKNMTECAANAGNNSMATAVRTPWRSLPYTIHANTVTVQCPAGVDGEICYRGRHIMMGYMGNPDLGAAHIKEIEGKNRSAIDDDGWLLVQMYRPQEHRTEIAILDARRVDAGPVCRLKLRHHLPFSFHSTYSPEVLGVTHAYE